MRRQPSAVIKVCSGRVKGLVKGIPAGRLLQLELMAALLTDHRISLPFALEVLNFSAARAFDVVPQKDGDDRNIESHDFMVPYLLWNLNF